MADMHFSHIRASSELIFALSILWGVLATSEVQAPEATNVSTQDGQTAEYVGVADGAELGRPWRIE